MKSTSKIVLVLNYPEREKRTFLKIQTAIEEINPHAEATILEKLDPNFMAGTLAIAPQVIMAAPFTALTNACPFYMLKYLLDCVMVCYRTEGLLPVNTLDQDTARSMTGFDKYGVNLVDFEIFWGRKTADPIGRALVQDKKLSSVSRSRHLGWPFFEDYTEEMNNRDHILPQVISRKVLRYPRTRRLLFVTGFPQADYTREDAIRAGDYVDIGSHGAKEKLEEKLSRFRKAGEFRKNYMETISECAQNNSDFLFIVKIHPLEIIQCKNRNHNPYKALKDIHNILLITEPIPFRSIIHHCSLLFHYGSTTMLEAYLMKVPSVHVSDSKIKYRGIFEIPSTLSADLLDIPGIIARHRATSVTFERNETVERVLEEQLGVKVDQRYKPSEDIARFLLSLDPDSAQTILPTDRYLIDATKKIGKSRMIDRIDSARLKAVGQNRGEFMEEEVGRNSMLIKLEQIPLVQP